MGPWWWRRSFRRVDLDARAEGTEVEYVGADPDAGVVSGERGVVAEVDPGNAHFLLVPPTVPEAPREPAVHVRWRWSPASWVPARDVRPVPGSGGARAGDAGDRPGG